MPAKNVFFCTYICRATTVCLHNRLHKRHKFVDVKIDVSMRNGDYCGIWSGNSNDSVVLLNPVRPHDYCFYLNLSPLNNVFKKGGKIMKTID